MIRPLLSIGFLSGAVCLSLLAGCSDDGGPSFVPASADPQQNVMVIDQGFDLAAAELSGKVAAAYTVICPLTDAPAPDGFDAPGTGGRGALPSFEEAKRDYLAILGTPDESCHLREGISAKPDPLGRLRSYRSRWNSMLREQQRPDMVFTEAELSEIFTVLDTELGTFPYHGTATAGVAAYGNAGLRLVLVEVFLGDAQSAKDAFTCLWQDDLDRYVALLSDPEVHHAYVHQPPSRLDRDLEAAAKAHNVGLVNESFGSFPRAVLEDLQMRKGCPAIDLRPYFASLSEAQRAQVQAQARHPRLTVKSAGNEGRQIDVPADALRCAPGDPSTLLVGSLDAARQLSTFTNFGACVDVYAPGEQVIAPYAGGWLLPVDGTSFAAPLVARTLSLQPAAATDAAYDPAALRQQLLDRRLPDGLRSLPSELFPADMFWTPTAFSPLTVAGARPRVVPGRGVDADTAARADLRSVLAPLERLRRLAQRRR